MTVLRAGRAAGGPAGPVSAPGPGRPGAGGGPGALELALFDGMVTRAAGTGGCRPMDLADELRIHPAPARPPPGPGPATLVGEAGHVGPTHACPGLPDVSEPLPARALSRQSAQTNPAGTWTTQRQEQAPGAPATTSVRPHEDAGSRGAFRGQAPAARSGGPSTSPPQKGPPHLRSRPASLVHSLRLVWDVLPFTTPQESPEKSWYFPTPPTVA